MYCALLLLLCSSVLAVCVVPKDAMIIEESVTFCEGEYILDSGITLRGEGVSLDCDHATLRGSQSGKGIMIDEGVDSRVKNCNIEDYDIGIYVYNSEKIQLEKNTFVNNRRETQFYDDYITIPDRERIVVDSPPPLPLLTTVDDFLLPKGVSIANFLDAKKDIGIEKTKKSGNGVTTYTVLFTPRKNIDSVEYFESGVFSEAKTFRDLRRGEVVREQFMTPKDTDSVSIVFNKKLTWWNGYLIVLALLMLSLIHYVSLYESRHKQYLYVKRKDPILSTFLFLESLDLKAKKIGFVFFSFLILTILMPVIDIFTVQFLGTIVVLFYVFYFLRLVRDVEIEERK